MLLFPAYFDNEPPSSSNPSSDRGLDDPLAVLSTMIEHRKRERAERRLAPLGPTSNDGFQKIR